jgi:hypothetical protein
MRKAHVLLQIIEHKAFFDELDARKFPRSVGDCLKKAFRESFFPRGFDALQYCRAPAQFRSGG